MLVERIRERMVEAMKARDAATRGILKVALGEIQARAVRDGRDLTDDEAVAVVRKIVKANEESIAAAPDTGTKERLGRENEILGTLVPRTLDEDETSAALGPVADDLRAAASEGQATGLAMKHLKAQGASVDGRTVAAAVRRLRA